MKKALACVISIIAVAVLIIGCEQVHTHEFGEWDEVKVSSCIEDGKRVRLCECGEAEEEIISATGHVEEVIAEKIASCTKSGLTEGKKCSVCGVITVKQEAVEAIGHEEKTLDAVAPTCDADGLTEGVECSRCGKILVAQDSVAAIGHSYVYYVDENGEDYMLCTRDDCGATVENAAGLYDEDNKLIASWDELVNVYEIESDLDSFSSIYDKNKELNKGTMLVIDESVTEIAGMAFYLNDVLKSVKIPDGVLSIGMGAFYECSRLTEIKIPASVIEIYNCAFENCQSLKNIFVDEDNENFKSIDGNLYDKTGKTFIQYANAKADEEFVVPDGVESIKLLAFCYSHSLKSITIPSSVTSIGVCAFDDCDSLRDIYFEGTADEWKKIDMLRSGSSMTTLIHYEDKIEFYISSFIKDYYSATGGWEDKIIVGDEEIYRDGVLYTEKIVNDYYIEYDDSIFNFIKYEDDDVIEEKIAILEKIKECDRYYVLEKAVDDGVPMKMVVCYVENKSYFLEINCGQSDGNGKVVHIYKSIFDFEKLK